jgi:hypothetical protein
MALTEKQQQLCKDAAEFLKEGDWDTYKQIRTNLNKFPELTKDGGAEAYMAIIFHILPQSAQDMIAAQLMSEALEQYANKS